MGQFSSFVPGDADEEDKLWEAILEKGEEVARHNWNSRSPGAGAGSDVVYAYNGLYYAENDFGYHGPFETFEEAAEEIGLSETETTESIWIDPRLRDDV